MRVVLHLSWTDTVSWVLSSVLEIALLSMILFRKTSRQIYLFSAYFLCLMLRDLWWFWAVRYVPNISTTNHFAYYITYWISEFALCLLRLTVAVQIWRISVRAYPAIWKITWRALWFVSIGLSIWTALSAYAYRDWIAEFFYVGVQRFEFMQAFLLVIILAFAVQFRIDFNPGYRFLLYGLCFYSLTQCIIATLSSRNPVLTFAWFNVAREAAYDLALIAWICALYKMVPLVTASARTVSAEAYAALSPEVNLRLRHLNNRMTEMLNL